MLAVVVSAVTIIVSMLHPPQNEASIGYTMLWYSGADPPPRRIDIDKGSENNDDETEHLLDEDESVNEHSKVDRDETVVTDSNPIATEGDHTPPVADIDVSKKDETPAIESIEPKTLSANAAPGDDDCGPAKLHYGVGVFIVLLTLVFFTGMGSGWYGLI